MEEGITGLVAVTMFFAVPLGGMFTYYRIRKLRTEEKLAAIARGVSVPMEPELSQAARSRRSGILLVAGSLGYMIAFSLIARNDSGCVESGCVWRHSARAGSGILFGCDAGAARPARLTDR